MRRPERVAWWNPWTWPLLLYPWYDRRAVTVDDLSIELVVSCREKFGIPNIRTARRLIAQGRVALDGVLVTDPYAKIGRFDDLDVWIDGCLNLKVRYEGDMRHTTIRQWDVPVVKMPTAKIGVRSFT